MRWPEPETPDGSGITCLAANAESQEAVPGRASNAGSGLLDGTKDSPRKTER
jgi:hypothetical protein